MKQQTKFKVDWNKFYGEWFEVFRVSNQLEDPTDKCARDIYYKTDKENQILNTFA